MKSSERQTHNAVASLIALVEIINSYFLIYLFISSPLNFKANNKIEMRSFFAVQKYILKLWWKRRGKKEAAQSSIRQEKS